MRQPKEIEFAYLGCIFDNPTIRIPEAFRVKTNVEWFSDITCRLVWTAIENLHKKVGGTRIKPLVIIEEALRIASRRKSPFYGQKITPDFIDEAKRFRDSAEEGEQSTIEAYAPVLQDAAIGRKLNQSMDDIRTEGKFSSNTVRMMELAKQIQQIQKEESPESGIDVSDLLDNMTSDYDRGYEEYAVKHNYNFVPGIPFPWDAISHLTKGLNPGLHIIAARPSVGKTSFILQCMNYWCDLGYKVAFDCLDMSVTEMIKRPVANIARVSPKRCEFGWVTPEEQLRVREATDKVRQMGKRGLLTITLETDVDKLKAWAEIRHKAGKLDILVIDFAQKFRLKGVSSEYEIVTYASGVLKQLANECLIPVVLLSQLSRDNVKDPNGKRPPELSDLRGSGALEQDATTVVLLHKVAAVNSVWRDEPPYYFVKQTNDLNLNREVPRSIKAVCWNLAKNQNGETGEIPFVVFQNWFRWYVGNLEEEKEVEQYQKIQADWRFTEEPLITAAKNDMLVYPPYWEKKCAETCGRLGIAIPENIRSQLDSWDIERYEMLLKEHNERISNAVETAATSIADAGEAPSIRRIVEEKPITRHATTPSERSAIDDLMDKLGDDTSTDEPSIEDEFADEAF